MRIKIFFLSVLLLPVIGISGHVGDDPTKYVNTLQGTHSNFGLSPR